MADIVTFRRAYPVQTRAEYIESMLALGRPAGLPMGLREVLAAARIVAWREATNIAEGVTGTWAYEPTERDMLPVISDIEPCILDEMAESPAVVVACDRMIAEMDALARRRDPGDAA